MSIAHKVWIILPESCHSCNFRPVIGFPGILPHIKHKDLEAGRSRPISSQPFSTGPFSSSPFPTPHTKPCGVAVPLLQVGSSRPGAESSPLGAPSAAHPAPGQLPAPQPPSPQPALRPRPRPRPASPTSGPPVPATGWQSRGSRQGQAAPPGPPSSCRRPRGSSHRPHGRPMPAASASAPRPAAGRVRPSSSAPEAAGPRLGPR